jgi:type VI secretion system secreted protein VgrG
MAITQENRELEIATPLGKDVLLLTSMSGTEQLSRPFRFELELASEEHQIISTDIVGQNVTIRLNLSGDNTRYFNGFISSFTQMLPKGGLASYRATVVPWLWFLTRTADCHIFQNMTVPDIIEQVFADHGFSDYERSLSGSYRTWEYCVQYRETDFNFVSRLMEQEGIYYFFKHENGKHFLVMADSASAHEPYSDFEELKYHPADKGTKTDECISDWVVRTHLQPCSYALNDFNFKKTKTEMLVRAIADRKAASVEFEIYDYPGEYTEPDDGNKYVRKRIEELQAQYEVVSALSDARGICTGCTFELTYHPREDQNKKYLITSANYNIDAGEFYSGGEGVSGCTYSCSFAAIDATQPFRSPRITPKPSIPGPQTAMVVGPSGEEIWTDKYGRVKVQFHWDREGTADENSSCWIRVAQVWAGKNWGTMYIPRIGQEVIIEFLEGDPDQPIITGRVYNDQAMPPYELPSEKTKSTLKSNSSKGGGGFNEIRFEDKKGSEQLFIQAEKDEDIVVKNNKTEKVGNNETINIGNDRTETVGNNETLTVVKNRTRNVGENETITVTMTRTHTVGINEAITIGAAQEVTVGAMRAVTVGASQSVNIGANLSENIGKNMSVKVGKNLLIDAGDQVTIKTGKASILMKKDGTIIISGKDITIKGSGNINLKASKNVVIKGKKILEN